MLTASISPFNQSCPRSFFWLPALLVATLAFLTLFNSHAGLLSMLLAANILFVHAYLITDNYL